ncbi:MAG: hypothetical protein ACW980_21735 [Promethearchaeota archaeon]|jgi:hypothetical protein
MKQFKNKETEMKGVDESKNLYNLCYSDILKQAINQAPQGGYTPEDMAVRFKLMNLLDKVKPGANVDVEDSDMIKLKSIASEFRGFYSVSKDANDFYEYFSNI